jgi:hypothetical protein
MALPVVPAALPPLPVGFMLADEPGALSKPQATTVAAVPAKSVQATKLLRIRFPQRSRVWSYRS